MLPKAQDDELVMKLVELTLTLKPEERERYLRGACGGDGALFDSVWSYVEAQARMSGFLLAPLCPPLEIESPFEPGQVLEGRFRVVREIARGGMGVVYEAEDERLRRRIAIKCARTGFRRRLPPEVRNASEISHPNVCKIFEIHTAATSSGEVDFLTMEYLDGEPLSAWLKRGLGAAQAREIAWQVCAGLEAAHKRQVVHGDLKGANVLVTREADGRLRAVITDFGLARQAGGADSGLWAAPPGGTPDFMAPELWKGEAATPASDVYAMGVLLKQIDAATGNRPGWEAIWRRCLAADPAERYADASALLRALRPAPRRWMLAAAAAVIAAAVSGGVTYRSSAEPVETVRLGVEGSETAAGRGIFARIGELRGSRRTRFEVAASPGVATHVLKAAVRTEESALRLDAVLTEARTGTRMREWTARYEPGEPKHIPTALAGFVSGAFHLPALPAGVNAAARQDYENGLHYLKRNSTVNRAVPLLERAAASDPDSPLTHAALAEAYLWNYQVRGEPGWLDRGGEALRRAEKRNPDLAEVLNAAGFLAIFRGRFEQAAAALGRAAELAPGDGDAHRRLGVALQASGDGAGARAAFQRAIEAEPGNYRNHQAMGDYHQRRAEYAIAAKHFAKAAELAPEEPRAHFVLAVALASGGRFAEAEKAGMESLNLEESPEALNLLGTLLAYQGRDQDSLPYFQRALKWWPDRDLVWMNVGTAYRRLGLGNDARAAYARARELAEAGVVKNPRSGYGRSVIAYASARLGDMRRAENEIAQAVQLSPDDTNVLRMAVKTYEALGRREESLGILRRSPAEVGSDLARFPDLAELQRDPRFQSLITKLANEESTRR